MSAELELRMSSPNADYTTEIIQAPRSGKSIPCASKGLSLIPYDKIRIWSAGKVPPPSYEELRALQRTKQTQRKLFDQDPANHARLEKLIRQRTNHQRSIAMANVMRKAGLDPESRVHQEELISHLFKVSENITEENRQWYDSEFEGARGKMIISSTWKILPDGRRYLTTLILKTPKELE